MLIVLSGLPGTGKSAIAAAVAAARRAPLLSVDPIESAILQAGIAATFETGLAAYLIAQTLADGDLAAGLDVVIDAVNAVEPAREMWRALAAKHQVGLRVIECVLSDEAVHRERVASRDRGLALAEPSWESVQQRGDQWRDWPEPHLKLDAVDPLDLNVAKALAYAREADGAKSDRPAGGT